MSERSKSLKRQSYARVIEREESSANLQNSCSETLYIPLWPISSETGQQMRRELLLDGRTVISSDDRWSLPICRCFGQGRRPF